MLHLRLSNGSMHAPPYGYTNCKAKFWLADEILEAICHLVTASLFLVTISRICLVHLRGKEELVKINEQRNYSRAYVPCTSLFIIWHLKVLSFNWITFYFCSTKFVPVFQTSCRNGDGLGFHFSQLRSRKVYNTYDQVAIHAHGIFRQLARIRYFSHVCLQQANVRFSGWKLFNYKE